MSKDQTIKGSTFANLYAFEVTDDKRISSVKAVIKPPGYSQNSEGATTAINSVNLMPVGNNRYEGAYDGFNIAGTYQIAIYAEDSDENRSVPKLTTVNVESPLKRKAIIVAGCPQSDALWPAVEKSVQSAWKALNVQRYPPDDIYLVSPVSIPDVPRQNVPPNPDNLNYALNTWTAEDTQDIVLYMVGKGFDSAFNQPGRNTDGCPVGYLVGQLTTKNIRHAGGCL